MTFREVFGGGRTKRVSFHHLQPKDDDDDDDDDMLETEKADDQESLFQFQDDDALPLLLPPMEREGHDTTSESIANWVHSFLVQIGMVEDTTTLPPSSKDDRTMDPQDEGCILCPEDDDDDDDGFSNLLAAAKSVAPTTTMDDESLGCELCPQDDDYSNTEDSTNGMDAFDSRHYRGDGTVIQAEGDDTHHHPVRRLNRAMWTFDGLLERFVVQTTTHNPLANDMDALWEEFHLRADLLVWSELFCDCFLDEEDAEAPHHRDATICQIRYTDQVY